MKQYLGDSVYVDYNGYALILTTNNGYNDDPRNRIALDPEVYLALVKYVQTLARAENPEPDHERQDDK